MDRSTFASYALAIAFAPAALTSTAAAAESTAAAVESSVAPLDSGIDNDLFSETVPPGENFYDYANQKWLETTAIPADKSNYGIFTVLDDETRQKVRELIESAAETDADDGTAAQKVGDLYKSVLNLDARESAGITPVRPFLESIAAAADAAQLAAVAGELSRAGVNGPFAGYVDSDAKDSTSYAIYLTQSGLTMPDRDYYLVDEPRYENARAELKSYLQDLLAEIGETDPAAAADTVVRIETALAQQQWTNTENRDPVKTYNKQTLQQFAELLGPEMTGGYIASSGIDSSDSVVVRQLSYFESIASITDQFELDDWKTYYRARVMDSYADSLTESLEQRHFDFHGTVISGIDSQEPLWKRAVNVTSGVLGELVGQLYVEKYFRPEAKKRMNELVENLKLAFKNRILSRDWMNDGTKKQALEKLSKFATKIGYPDEWKDYDKLKIESAVLADNLIAANEFEHQRELNKLGQPIDRNEWHMTPQTINAYYNPGMNEIVFPAAILQPPFFNLRADDAVNYGAIGAVIGHEISHGFDDKGSQYDGDGNLRMWWTPTDREEFERRAAGLSKQYSGYEPVAGNFVNGELTLGENIGDLGGLSVSYEAYQLSLAGKPAAVIDGLSGDQRFFLGWAQIWRRLYREPELLKRLVTDPHSPSEYRVNGIVRNMDAWYDAFGVEQDAAMYLPPDQRVRIW